MHRLHTYLWPAASITSGGAGRTAGRRCLFFVLHTVRPAVSKTVTMAVIFARFSVDLHTTPASPANSKPRTGLRTCASVSTSNPPSPKSSSRCTKSSKNVGPRCNLAERNVSLCREKYIAKKRRQYTSLPQSLSGVMPSIVFTVIHTHASLHAFVELANNGHATAGAVSWAMTSKSSFSPRGVYPMVTTSPLPGKTIHGVVNS